ncbi:MAG TPA: hypothetical protein DCQ06_00160 [Myxococcales bacterium]|nr:hypothetical protein [Myxococcales bacterium]
MDSARRQTWYTLIFVALWLGACTDAPSASTPSDVSAQDSEIMVDAGPDAGLLDDASDDAGQLDGSVAPLDASSGDLQEVAEDTVAPQAYPLPVGVSLDAIVTIVDKGPWQSGAAVGQTKRAAQSADGKVATLGPVAGQVDELEGTLKGLVAALELQKVTYMLDAEGLHGVLSGKLIASPLNAALPTGVLTAALHVTAQGADDLWLVVGAQLCLYRAGKLFTIDAPGLNPTNAQLSFGGDVQGDKALWVAGQSGVHALRVDGAKVTSWHYLKDRIADAVHVDKQGRGRVLSQGEVLRRDEPGAWSTWTTEPQLQWVRGRHGDATFWAGGAGQLYRWEAGELHAIANLPKIVTFEDIESLGSILGLDAAGQLVSVATTPPPVQPKVTWKIDIEPIFINSCKLCHGADGVNTKLHTAKQWEDLYPKIISNVESGAMPLDPLPSLTPGEIALIKSWKKDGFSVAP